MSKRSPVFHRFFRHIPFGVVMDFRVFQSKKKLDAEVRFGDVPASISWDRRDAWGRQFWEAFLALRDARAEGRPEPPLPVGWIVIGCGDCMAGRRCAEHEKEILAAMLDPTAKNLGGI